ncbi:MAG: FtsX-like permease family protein [Eubacterium sp.]|nr:FtsX-like permease family protein [Eubacterium sp.]
MIRRLIFNDFKANKLITISTCAFMTITAMLLGLAIFLFAGLSASIDSLMKKAETPHFLQMHTGELREEELNVFTEGRHDVEEFQIARFLNLQNGQISIDGKSFETNMQDNGLCCQSECFDYLLDADNKVIQVSDGEVFVPVAYKKEYGIRVGDEMHIGRESLTVAGFLRDSQMNSMMASSKRFLVSESDYERLKVLGSEEYLIEYRLREGNDVNRFATEYKDAGLPDNGPTITYPLIKTMNALSDGIMILIILFVSIIVLLISIICIRYIILTQLEKDRREIGMLKAVGISRKDIRFLYISKYLLLSIAGCVVGSILALMIAGPLGTGMKELYGDTDNKALVYIFMIIGAFLAEGIILLSVRRTLRTTDRESVITSLYGRDTYKREKNLWHPAAAIATATVFMMLIPLGMKSTIASPDFVTYMGIGKSDIRVDVRQSDDIEGQTRRFIKRLESDNRVKAYSVMQTRSYKVILPDGQSYNLMLENGDHSAFPVSYNKGTYPKNDREIALSLLNAEEMGLGIGDRVKVISDIAEGETKECTVCGIYSDITNGGKTAKGCMDFGDTAGPPMWSIIYISLKDENAVSEWVNEYQDNQSALGEGIKIIEISDYLKGTYGPTISKISYASVMTFILAGIIIFVVMLLLVRLIIWKERTESSLKKALGLSTADIRGDYLKKIFIYVSSGGAIGVIAGVVLGQKLAGGLLGFMGAKGLKFVIDPLMTFVFTPALLLIITGISAVISLMEIRRIRASECLNSGLE